MIQLCKRDIGIMLTHIVRESYHDSFVALKCGTGSIRLNSCQPLGKEIIKFLVDNSRRRIVLTAITIWCITQHHQMIVPILSKFSYDLLDSFIQSLFGTFLRHSRGYPFTLTLSCFVLVVKNNILFSVFHGSDVFIGQTCFHFLISSFESKAAEVCC